MEKPERRSPRSPPNLQWLEVVSEFSTSPEKWPQSGGGTLRGDESSDAGDFNASLEPFFFHAELVALLVEEGLEAVLRDLRRGDMWQGTGWGTTWASRKLYDLPCVRRGSSGVRRGCLQRSGGCTLAGTERPVPAQGAARACAAHRFVSCDPRFAYNFHCPLQ